MVAATTAEVGPAIRAVERKLAEIEGTMTILLAARLLDKGYASNWKAAVALARDPEKARAAIEGRDDRH